GSAGAPGCESPIVLTENAAPAAAPPIDCSYPGALVCNDFETGQLPYWRVSANPGAEGSLQSCLVHGGDYALRVVPHDIAHIQVQEPLVPNVGSGMLYLRTFLYIPQAAVLPDWTVIYEVWDSPSSWS